MATVSKEMEANEPLLRDNPDRFCMFPIHFNSVWEMYKKAEASFWTGDRIAATTTALLHATQR